MNVDDSHMDAAGDEAALGSPAGPSITSTRFPDRTRPRYDEQSAHEHSLRCELEHVRQVNGAIEGVIKSLGKAKDNMKVRNCPPPKALRKADRSVECQQYRRCCIYPP